MTYREAVSLRTLLATINKRAPRRSTATDGWIGDAAHASRDSDHNPWIEDANGVGVVRARDFTHDVNGGLNGHTLAKQLAAQLGKHPALGSGAYVIWNRRIISTDRLAEGWRPYSGSNAHTSHVHLSVGTRGYDSRAAWTVLGAGRRAPSSLANLRRALLEALDTYAPRVPRNRRAARAFISALYALLRSPRFPQR